MGCRFGVTAAQLSGTETPVRVEQGSNRSGRFTDQQISPLPEVERFLSYATRCVVVTPAEQFRIENQVLNKRQGTSWENKDAL
jgi:hypothetical protein